MGIFLVRKQRKQIVVYVGWLKDRSLFMLDGSNDDMNCISLTGIQ